MSTTGWPETPPASATARARASQLECPPLPRVKQILGVLAAFDGTVEQRAALNHGRQLRKVANEDERDRRAVAAVVPKHVGKQSKKERANH